MANHTPETKTRARQLYRDHGLAHASRETGIAKSTITGWLTDDDRTGHERSAEKTERATVASQQRWQERRVQLKHRFGAVAQQALDLAEEKMSSGSARDGKDALLAAAIAVDKAEALDVHEDREAHAGRAADRAGRVEQARAQGLSLVPQAGGAAA